MKRNPEKPAKNSLHGLYLAGFALALVLPLLDIPPWFSPPDWGKVVIFRVVISLLALLFTCQILFKKITISLPLNPRDLSSWPYLLFGGLFIIFFVSTILSLDPNFSLWGSPYRNGGFINAVAYFIFTALAFFIVKKEDWPKLIKTAVITGLAISFIASCQRFGLLKELFITNSTRPPSTVGGPIFLAVYLTLLTFPAIGYCFSETKKSVRIFYGLSAVVFIITSVIITQTRAALVGLIAGLLFFVFFYPRQRRLFKIIAGIFVVVLLSGYGLLITNQQLYASKNDIISSALSRIASISRGDSSRLAAWKISIEALKDHPFLGYGPENYSIGFDRHFDPRLPVAGESVTKTTDLWWDRAHNFIFDIGVTSGIPAVILYLAFFAVLFWRLDVLKRTLVANHAPIDQSLDKKEAILSHSLQAGFIAYLVANLFSFDTYSSFIVVSFLVAYSLSLVDNINLENERHLLVIQRKQPVSGSRMVIAAILAVLTVIFIVSYNLKPFIINSRMNIAKQYIDSGKCDQGLSVIDQLSSRRSILDSYLRLTYADSLKKCVATKPNNELVYAQKGDALMKENVLIQPYFTRNWLLLGEFISFELQKEADPEKKAKLTDEARSAYRRAQELSPKRTDAVIGLAEIDTLVGDYADALKKADECIDLDPKSGECHWLKGIALILTKSPGENVSAEFEIANKLGYDIYSLSRLKQRASAYQIVKDYLLTAEYLEKIVYLVPNDPEYRTLLAYTYRDLGEYERAREEALKVAELVPETKGEVDEFIKSLPPTSD